MSELNTVDTPANARGIRSPLHHAQAIFAAFDAENTDALAALMTEDVRLQIGNADVVHGKVAFVQALQAFFGSVTSVRHTVTNVWTDQDTLIAELSVDYTRVDRGEVTLPCCNVPPARRRRRRLPRLHRHHAGLRAGLAQATAPCVPSARRRSVAAPVRGGRPPNDHGRRVWRRYCERGC